MYDLERVGKIVADIERYFVDVEKLKVTGASMSRERFYSLSMLLFAILNRALDLGQELVRGRKLGMPGSYKEIFQLLEREKVIPADLSRQLQYLASQRNVLAHEYFDVTEESIFQVYTKIGAAKELVNIVRKLLRR